MQKRKTNQYSFTLTREFIVWPEVSLTKWSKVIVTGLKKWGDRKLSVRDKEDITTSNIKWVSAYKFPSVDTLSLSYCSHLLLLLTQFFSSWYYNYLHQSALGKNPHLTFLHLLTASFFLSLLFTLNISEGKWTDRKKYLTLSTYFQNKQGKLLWNTVLLFSVYFVYFLVWLSVPKNYFMYFKFFFMDF